MSILIVEDDRAIAQLMKAHLERDAYHVKTVDSGNDALPLIQANAVDLVLVDLMLPGEQGWDLTRDIRKLSSVPIMVVSALGDLERRLQLFRIGADDYLVKPFDLAELGARVQAVLRRVGRVAASTYRFGSYAFSSDSKQLRRHDQVLALTQSEFVILEALLQNIGRTLTRNYLQTRLRTEEWQSNPTSRTIDMHIASLRHKLEDDARHPYWIQTVWGVGYSFRESHDAR